MSKHSPKRHSTEARVPQPEGGSKKIQVFVATCTPCGVYGKPFTSRASRDKFLNDFHPA